MVYGNEKYQLLAVSQGILHNDTCYLTLNSKASLGIKYFKYTYSQLQRSYFHWHVQILYCWKHEPTQNILWMAVIQR